jgi:DNA-directed RNA polymerase specialized sigma24 family protein
VKADATDLPPPARALIAPEPAEAVTALYQAHALGLIRLAVVMLGDRGAAEDAVQALVLRFYLDLDEGEIAATMRISRGTVKSTTSRALAALGRILGEQS